MGAQSCISESMSACDISVFLNRKSAISNCTCKVNGNQLGCELPKWSCSGMSGSISYPSASHGVSVAMGSGWACNRGEVLHTVQNGMISAINHLLIFAKIFVVLVLMVPVLCEPTR